MKVALKHLEPLLRIGYAQLLRTGRPDLRFGGMLPREKLGNWLVCAAFNFDHPDTPVYFTTDPDGGDGLIVNDTYRCYERTEHVYVPPPEAGETRSGDELIRDAVAHKMRKGVPYARGKMLVVLLEGLRPWQPTNAATMLPPGHAFKDVFVAGVESYIDDEYTFAVACLTLAGHTQAPTFRVRIARAFDDWEVTRAQ